MKTTKQLLELLDGDFSICRVQHFEGIDWSAPFLFAAKTDHEMSLVCQTGHLPDHLLAREDGWRALRFAGTLDFALTGVLADIAGVLAQAAISIFAVSTFETDYLLVREISLAAASEALEKAGYAVCHL